MVFYDYDPAEEARLHKRRLEREARMVKFEIHYVTTSYHGEMREWREVVKALSARKAVRQLREKQPKAFVFSCKDSKGQLARLSFKTMNPQFSKSAHAEHHRSLEARIERLENQLGGLKYRAAAPTYSPPYEPYENVGLNYDPESDAKNRDANALIHDMSNKVNADAIRMFGVR